MAPDSVLAIRRAALGAPRRPHAVGGCLALHSLSQVSGQCADFWVTKGRQASPIGANMGESMSNDVQSHEEVAERAAGEERRAGVRHAARSLGSVTARIIGGSQVELVNFSNRGVLFECDSRLLIGARASVRITTTDTNLIVSGRVVRSRVKGLVDGALRYDAALLLDGELGLVPAFIDAPAASDDSPEGDDLAFESELDATFDPSPVEAYLAESEASLLEVAHGVDLPLHQAAAPPVEASEVEEPAAHEPIAFDDDAEIAFEPAVEFAFDEAGEPSFDDALEAVEGPAAVASEAVAHADATAPVSASMFDATYMPPAIAAVVDAESQFDMRPPRPAVGAAPSSFFDAHRSESYGEPAADPAVAFEAEDAVAFEEAFEAAPIVDAAPVDCSTPDQSATTAPADTAPDEFTLPPAPVSDTEDRVLLQFAATVPHDLAELRRIAADNQW
jgi:hypothetical protein